MYNARTLVLVIFVYGIQLYLDFSGYSDIAIGISKCLGFEMPCNFNLPYLSRNVSEFWKRWHISLSNWLMEYIYIPLGGNRKGFFRSCINLLITMIIGGIWHGASWNFVCWGAWCGALLVMHKIYIHVCNIPKTYIPAIPKFITGVLVTYIANIFGFFILGVPNWKVFVLVMKRVILGKTGVSFYSTWAIAGTIFVFLEIVISIVKELKNSKYEYKYAYVNIFYPMFNLNRFKDLVIFFVIAGLAFGLIYTNSSPFMYAAF